MKKKVILYGFFAVLFAISIEITSLIWRKGILIDPYLQSKYYIGAFYILLFGILTVIFLCALRKEVYRMEGKHNILWSNVIKVLIIINFIGIPLYLIAFLLNRFLS